MNHSTSSALSHRHYEDLIVQEMLKQYVNHSYMCSTRFKKSSILRALPLLNLLQEITLVLHEPTEVLQK